MKTMGHVYTDKRTGLKGEEESDMSIKYASGNKTKKALDNKESL